MPWTLFLLFPLLYVTLAVFIARRLGERASFLALAFASPVIFSIGLAVLPYDSYGLIPAVAGGLFFAILLTVIFGTVVTFHENHTQKQYALLFSGFGSIFATLWFPLRALVGHIFAASL